jgi:maltose O-acetyltransferase
MRRDALSTEVRWWVAVQRDAFRDVLLNSIIGARLWPRDTRRQLLRWAGVRIGVSTFESHVSIVGGRRLAIGAGSFVNTGCLLDASAPLTIGNHVSIGHGAMLVTSTHDLGGEAQRAGAWTARPVTVEDGVWIGARALILPAVTVGRGCVVAAGAVVQSDCEPNGLYAGVPARRVRDLS